MKRIQEKWRKSRQTKRASHQSATDASANASQLTQSSSPSAVSSGGHSSTSKAGKSLDPPTFPYGIEVWHDCEDAVVDICFIHGLTGDRNRTWTAHGQSEPWPKKLLPPKLPNARIMTYGYDAYVMARDGSGVSSNRLSDHARNLINDLAGDTIRGNAAATGRPIIFVTHSLGGLVCKKGLLISRNSPHQPHCEIFKNTCGVIFMGTPHWGSWFAEWARKPVSMLRLFTSCNKALLDVLDTNSELLEDINHGFEEMVRNTPQIRMHCFFEELPVAGKLMVVPKSSAIILGYNHLSIHADHRDMVRFSSNADTGFVRVLNVLLDWTRVPLTDGNVNQAGDLQAQMSLPAPLEGPHSASVEAVPPASVEYAVPASMEEVPPTPEALPPPSSWEACLQSLAFPSMQARYKDIEPAVSGTCTWFLEHPTYKSWIETHQGLLWIMGNPGVGKSTLTKFAFEHGKSKAASGDDDPLILSFFIHARGDELQKTPEGLFRALLHQILSKEPHSLLQLIATFDEHCKSYGRAGEAWRWHRRDLLGNLESCLPPLVARRPVWIYIDALDELGKDNAVDIVQTFKSLLRHLGADGNSNNTVTGDTSTPNLQFRLCFSCRYFPIINTDQSVMEINVAKENARDIGTFVEGKLVSATSPDVLSSSIPKLIKEGANGVFLWASLVVAQVLQLHREGAGLKRIEAKIHAIPETLEKLYQDMLGVMGAESLWLIQWVCFAARPLRLDELQWALTFDPESPQQSLHECRQSKAYVESLDSVRRQIQTLSCGLVELVSSDWSSYQFVIPPLTWGNEDLVPHVGQCYTVQFIHQSVKDFFLDHGLQALDTASTTSEQATAVANLRLTKACLYLMTMKEVVEYYAADSTKSITWAEATNPDLVESVPDEELDDKMDDLRFPLFTSFPMLDYAAMHWIEHAKLACSYGRSVIETGWPFDLWTSPVFIEMENRLNQLLWTKGDYADLDRFPQTQSLRGPTALHLAARHGLRAILDVIWDRAASATTTTDLLFMIPSFGAITSTLIEEAARGNHEEILRMLMDGSDEILVGLTLFPLQEDLPLPFEYPYLIHNPMPQSAISWAAWHGNLTIAKLLCKHRLVYHPNHLSNALYFAADQGHMAMIRFLLDEGATFGTETFRGAFTRPKEDEDRYVGRTLLELFSTDILQHEKVNSLSDTAAYFSEKNLLRIRLEAFLEYSDQDWRRQVLNELAIDYWFHKSIDAAAAARKIIQVGPINVDWTGDSGSTLLALAAEYRDVRFLQVLVEAGADLERSCSGSEALIAAVTVGKEENVAFLLRMGANPNYVDDNGWTPLLHARSPDIYELLLDAGADLEYESPSGETALVAAVKKNKIDMDGVRYLVDRGANLQRKPLVLEAVRYWARYSDELQVLRELDRVLGPLLELGADIDLANDEGETALTTALGFEHGCSLVIRYLASKGANVRNRPLLGMAFDRFLLDLEKIETVKLLLELGAEVNAPYNGQTPFQILMSRYDFWESGIRLKFQFLLLKWGARVDGCFYEVKRFMTRWEREQKADVSPAESSAESSAEIE